MSEEVLMKIASDVGEIKGLVEGIRDRVAAQNGRLDKAETNITDLKVRDAYVAGGSAVGGGVIAWVVNKLFGG